jgi:hypothetical protein
MTAFDRRIPEVGRRGRYRVMSGLGGRAHAAGEVAGQGDETSTSSARHWGFEGPPNPGQGDAEKAVAAVNSLSEPPVSSSSPAT